MQQHDLDNILIPIGQLASMLKVHPRTLRIYEEEKILAPKRSSGNRRMYSISDLEKAKLIIFLSRNLGINLSGIKIILAMLEKINIKPENYFKCINEIANNLNIDINTQNDNILKNSKRGRPKSKL